MAEKRENANAAEKKPKKKKSRQVYQEDTTDRMTVKQLSQGPCLKSGKRSKSTARNFEKRVQLEHEVSLVLDDLVPVAEEHEESPVSSLWKHEATDVEALKVARKAIGVVVRGASEECPAPIEEGVEWSAEVFSAQPLWEECGKSLLTKNRQKAVKKKPGMTPVQKQAWPAALSGLDVLAIAPTGSGKTLAYLLPCAARLLIEKSNRGALIVAPTRELAKQVAKVASKLAKWAGSALELALVVGGDGEETRAAQAASFAKATLTVATPGRLLDLAGASASCRAVLARMRCLVVDEADRMLQLGFEKQLHELASLLPNDRQTLLFTATFPLKLREAAAKWWARGADKLVTIRVNTLKIGGEEPAVVKEAKVVVEEKAEEKKEPVEGEEKVEEKEPADGEQPARKKVKHGPTSLAQISSEVVQTVHVCAKHKRHRLLLRFLDRVTKADAASKRRNASRVLIFCNTAVACKEVLELAQRHDHRRCAALHGKLPQKERDAALFGFRAGKTSVLVATDVASRGIDVARLPYVVNWDFPPSLETYTHRVGRVGRGDMQQDAALEPPTALSFFTRNLAALAPSLCAVLEATKQKVDPQLTELAEAKKTGNIDRQEEPKAPETAGGDDLDNILLNVLRDVAGDGKKKS